MKPSLRRTLLQHIFLYNIVPVPIFAMKSDCNHPTFGDRVVTFFDSLQIPKNLPSDVEVVYPYGRADVRQTMGDFYRTFFNDKNQRVFVLGINPGRFGSGMTEIPLK